MTIFNMHATLMVSLKLFLALARNRVCIHCSHVSIHWTVWGDVIFKSDTLISSSTPSSLIIMPLLCHCEIKLISVQHDPKALISGTGFWQFLLNLQIWIEEGKTVCGNHLWPLRSYGLPLLSFNNNLLKTMLAVLPTLSNGLSGCRGALCKIKWLLLGLAI